MRCRPLLRLQETRPPAREDEYWDHDDLTAGELAGVREAAPDESLAVAAELFRPGEAVIGYLVVPVSFPAMRREVVRWDIGTSRPARGRRCGP